MIRQHFGLTRDPFIIDHKAPLLTHQQRHFDILKVHSQQGGFCLCGRRFERRMIWAV